MRLDSFVDKNNSIKAENRLLRFTVVVVGIVAVVSAVLSYNAVRYQKIVILPPVVDKRIVISGNTVNDDYVRLFVRYATGLLFNYTPHTFRGQSKELLRLVTPEAYNAFNGRVTVMADNIERLLVSSVFYPQRMSINQSKKEVTVRGLRQQYSHSSSIGNKQKEYVIRYKIMNGRFYIDDIKEVSS